MKWIVLGLLCLNCPGAFEDRTWIRSHAFYREYFAQKPPVTGSEEEKFWRSRFLKKLEEPSLRSLLEPFDDFDLLRETLKFEALILALMDKELHIRLSSNRFRFLRDAFLRISRGSVGREGELARVLALSELPSLLSRKELQPMIGSLLEAGLLSAWLGGVRGAFRMLESHPDLAELQPAQDTQPEADAVRLMEKAQGFSVEVLEAARHLRDVKFVEAVRSPEFFAIAGRFQDGIHLLATLIHHSDAAPLLYEASHTGLLSRVFEEARRLEADWVADRLSEIHSQSLRSLESSVMVSFQHSRVGGILLGWSQVARVERLIREGLFQEWIQILPALVKMDEGEGRELFVRLSENQASLALREERVEERQIRRQELKAACLESMRMLMKVRERYNLLKRERIRLDDEGSAQELNRLAGDPPPCPSGGEYRNTPSEWIFCTVHGRAPIPANE